jgi:hypothetical protein
MKRFYRIDKDSIEKMREKISHIKERFEDSECGYNAFCGKGLYLFESFDAIKDCRWYYDNLIYGNTYTFEIDEKIIAYKETLRKYVQKYQSEITELQKEYYGIENWNKILNGEYEEGETQSEKRIDGVLLWKKGRKYIEMLSQSIWQTYIHIQLKKDGYKCAYYDESDIVFFGNENEIHLIN